MYMNINWWVRYNVYIMVCVSSSVVDCRDECLSQAVSWNLSAVLLLCLIYHYLVTDSWKIWLKAKILGWKNVSQVKVSALSINKWIKRYYHRVVLILLTILSQHAIWLVLGSWFALFCCSFGELWRLCVYEFAAATNDFSEIWYGEFLLAFHFQLLE